MVQVALAAAEFNQLNSQDVEELYADLALTDAGTAGTLGLNLSGLSTMKGIMNAEAAAAGDIWSWLVQKGKALFNDLWPQMKSLVCEIYKEDGDDASVLAGWVAKVATAILTIVNVTAAVAILVVTIAIKVGLNKLCNAGAEQPA